MRPTITARGVATLLVAVSACLPGTALAQAPTQTQIVSPTAAQTYAMFDHIDGTSAPTLAVSGTSNGTSGSVRVSCWSAEPSGFPSNHGSSDPMAVGLDGTFSGTIIPEFMSFGCPGTLRAVPVGLGIGSQDDVAPFTGPSARFGSSVDFQISGSSLAGNNGHSYDDYVSVQGAQGSFDIGTPGECGVYDGSVFDGYRVALKDFYCNGGFISDVPTGTAHRSAMLVDGHNAFDSYTAHGISASYAGFPFLTWSKQYDPATGNLTLHEATALVRCPSDTFNASTNAGNCPSFVDTGVTLSRTSVTDHEGRMFRQTDVFTSTSGAHEIDLQDRERWESSGVQTWKFPGDASPATHSTANEVIPIPAQSDPSSIEIQRDPGQTGDSLLNPRSAVTMWPAGDAFRIDGTQNNKGFMHYAATVPASGALTIERIYTHDWRAAEEASLRSAAEDVLMGPAVGIGSPADGATVTAGTITVTGTASDNVGVASTTVNGVTATLTSGSWSAQVPVAAGPVTLTAIATDAQGNQATATRSITATAPVVVPDGGAPASPTIAANGTVACPARGAACAASGTWTSRQAFAAAKKRHKVVLARWAATIQPGKSAKATATLTAVGKKLLRKRSIPVTRTITARAGTGTPVTATAKVTLKRIKHKKKR